MDSGTIGEMPARLSDNFCRPMLDIRVKVGQHEITQYRRSRQYRIEHGRHEMNEFAHERRGLLDVSDRSSGPRRVSAEHDAFVTNLHRERATLQRPARMFDRYIARPGSQML